MTFLGNVYRKNINNALEKAIEHLAEVMALLSTGRQPEVEEMKALLFAKRCMISFTDEIHEIFKNLIALKYLNHQKDMGIAVPENNDAFIELFQKFR